MVGNDLKASSDPEIQGLEGAIEDFGFYNEKIGLDFR